MLDRPVQLLVILLIEAVAGYPDAVYRRVRHPVVWVGTLISALERRWNAGSPRRRRALGVLLVLVLIAVSGGAGAAIELLAASSSAPWLATVGLILIATSGLAQRSLYDHVAAVARPLNGGDLEGARVAVARIVGRDTQTLDASGVSAAAIESLAESFCDGVVAPAFWFLVAGLPGLFICKALNTADSIVGHKDARHRAFGWAAARADDVMNLLPARIAGLLICVAGFLPLAAAQRNGAPHVSGKRSAAGTGNGAAGLGNGLCVMLSDAHKHASPNAGWPEAAMAGVLARQLGGAVSYDGELTDRPLFGGGPRPDKTSLRAAMLVYRRACVLLWLIVGGIAWLW